KLDPFGNQIGRFPFLNTLNVAFNTTNLPTIWFMRYLLNQTSLEFSGEPNDFFQN
ncbi:hypothetical protein PL2TA16_04121, partial [Pseudoalteromonas luteoviolacea 2ta16]